MGKIVQAIIRATNEQQLMTIVDMQDATKFFVAGYKNQHEEHGKMQLYFKESTILDGEAHGLWLIAFNLNMVVYTKIPVRDVTKEENDNARQFALDNTEDMEGYAKFHTRITKARVDEAIKGLQWNADKSMVPNAFFTA